MLYSIRNKISNWFNDKTKPKLSVPAGWTYDEISTITNANYCYDNFFIVGDSLTLTPSNYVENVVNFLIIKKSETNFEFSIYYNDGVIVDLKSFTSLNLIFRVFNPGDKNIIFKQLHDFHIIDKINIDKNFIEENIQIFKDLGIYKNYSSGFLNAYVAGSRVVHSYDYDIVTYRMSADASIQIGYLIELQNINENIDDVINHFIENVKLFYPNFRCQALNMGKDSNMKNPPYDQSRIGNEACILIAAFYNDRRIKTSHSLNYLYSV